MFNTLGTKSAPAMHHVPPIYRRLLHLSEQPLKVIGMMSAMGASRAVPVRLSASAGQHSGYWQGSGGEGSGSPGAAACAELPCTVTCTHCLTSRGGVPLCSWPQHCALPLEMSWPSIMKAGPRFTRVTLPAEKGQGRMFVSCRPSAWVRQECITASEKHPAAPEKTSCTVASSQLSFAM